MRRKMHSIFWPLTRIEGTSSQLISEWKQCTAKNPTLRPRLLLSTQEIVPVFRRAGSAHFAEYTGKVLLGFEAAGDGNIQHAHFAGTQHLLRSLDPIPQETLVRSLAGRVAEDLRKMRGAEPNCTRHFLKAYILLHF